jgi:hypothetical protein
MRFIAVLGSIFLPASLIAVSDFLNASFDDWQQADAFQRLS